MTKGDYEDDKDQLLLIKDVNHGGSHLSIDLCCLKVYRILWQCLVSPIWMDGWMG